MSVKTKEPTAVYRAFDAHGSLLYVGIAKNWGRRWAQHSERSRFFKDTARLEVEWADSREEALRQESSAILGEKPTMNIRGGNENSVCRGRALICPECLTRYGEPESDAEWIPGYSWALGGPCGDLRCGCGERDCWPKHRCEGILVEDDPV